MGSRRPLTAALVGVALAAILATLALVVSSRAEPVGIRPVHTGPVRHPAGRWVGSWMTAPVLASHLACVNCTIRDVVHSSAGGSALRVRLSNTFGGEPLVVEHTTVALPASPGSAAATPGTLRAVTFDGDRQVTVPIGASVWSDAVRLTVPAEHDLLVSMYVPGLPALTCHPVARQTSYLVSGPDAAGDVDGGRFTRTTAHWYLLTGVDVRTRGYRGVVVAFGDSITDGIGSTPGADHRWPDLLADRLLHLPVGHRMAVLNAGIAGNRLLLDGDDPRFGPRALSRLDRDVLSQTGVRTVILLEGINDIQEQPHQTDPARIIAADTELIHRMHARGLRVVGATLTPFGGWIDYSPRLEHVREAVNHWIRGSGAFDAVVDFDAAVRDPADPHRLALRYDSGDHLHPNDAGYAVMAATVDPWALDPGFLDSSRAQ